MSAASHGRLVRLLAALAAAGAVLAALAGCDGPKPAANRIHGSRLTVYVSVPLIGPTRWSGQATLDGARMALQSAHRAGRPLPDRPARARRRDHVRRGWNPGQTTANAHAAIKDPSTIGYIGDTNSGATAVAIPLLNRADVPQISPTSTAVGLTEGGLEAAPGEPQKYYPTKKRTFARVIPSDRIQAAVQVQLQRASDCDRIVVLDDGEVDGNDAAVSFDYAAQQAGLNVVSTVNYDPTATDYRSLGQGRRQEASELHPDQRVAPEPRSRGDRGDRDDDPECLPVRDRGLAGPGFVDPARGGIPLALDPR